MLNPPLSAPPMPVLRGAARPVHGLRPPATLHRSADMPALTFAQINALA